MKELTPKILLVLLIAVFWRIAQCLWPGIGMTIAGITIFVGLAIFYAKQPILRPTLKLAWLVALGAGLNFAATLANGGMMPIPHIMSSAWWVWLGDWLPGMVSPGDILMIVGFFGIAITVIRMQHKVKVIQDGALIYEK